MQYASCCGITVVYCVPSGQRGGVAFTPIAPADRQQSRIVVRRRSSDNDIGNDVRMVGNFLLFTSGS